jgi:hypothetical protein
MKLILTKWLTTDAHTMIWFDKNLVDGLKECENERPSNVTL